MKLFKKTNCLRNVEDKIDSLKKKREMTLEHELLLNNNIWYKIRTNLTLSPSEIKRLLKLRENGFKLKKLNSKKLWEKKKNQFKVLRSSCKE